MNCEPKAEGNCETQHAVPLSLEGDTLAKEVPAEPVTGRGLGWGWGCQHGEDMQQQQVPQKHFAFMASYLKGCLKNLMF